MGNFRVTLFSQILRSLLSCEIKICEILQCHAFYVAHMDHSQKIFREIIKIAIFTKFCDAKISRYTVYSQNFVSNMVYPIPSSSSYVVVSFC